MAVQPGSILSALHMARENARTVRVVLHCLGEIEGCAQTLKRNAPVVASIRDVMRAVEEVNPGALSQAELHLLIDEIQIGLAGIDETVRETYFA